MTITFNLILVFALSFLLNIPLGMWRSRTKKFSLNWFISIHLAVPLLYLLRVQFGLTSWIIPLLIIFVILGQLAGERLVAKCKRNKQEILQTKVTG